MTTNLPYAPPNGTMPTPLPSPRPMPLSTTNMLLASAQKLTKTPLGTTGLRQHSPTGESWQDDAWEAFDLVGELHFLATTLANRVSQAYLYVGELSDDPTEEPRKVDDATTRALLDQLGGNQIGRSQMLNRMAINLFVAGESWLVEMPELTEEGEPDPTAPTHWRVCSVDELRTSAEDMVVVFFDDGTQVALDPDEYDLIRVWRPHPRTAWRADSPTRSSLTVLRELIGLSLHLSAQTDSRLAGAGLLTVPKSAEQAIKNQTSMSAVDNDSAFTDALMEAMITPIQDRGSASAVVPLVVTVPDEVTDKFHYYSFSTPLDKETRNLREESLRRLALGLDTPPEILLGMGQSSHWASWMVKEDTLNSHILPPLALICDALTTQYLWPALREQGMAEEEVQKRVFWYDVSHMVTRPNLSSEALGLHQRGVLSDTALRRASGFEDADAPTTNEAHDPAMAMAFDLIRTTPSLLVDPGLPAVVEQLREVMDTDSPSQVGDADEEVPVVTPTKIQKADPPPREDTDPT